MKIANECYVLTKSQNKASAGLLFGLQRDPAFKKVNF